jgi:DIM1 family U5 snRNP protein
MFFYGCRVVEVRSDRGRDDVDWAAYSAAAFADLVQAVHAKAKANAGCLLFILPCRQ